MAVGFPGGEAGAPRPYSPPQRMWPATFRSVHRARHALEVTLREWELADLVDAAGLALSELMGNAVEHAYVPGRLVGVSVFRVEGGGVVLEVHDAEDEERPLRAAAAGPEQDRGRGLTLVDAMTCGRWGSVKRDGPGKVVWAALGPGPGVDAVAGGAG